MKIYQTDNITIVKYRQPKNTIYYKRSIELVSTIRSLKTVDEIKLTNQQMPSSNSDKHWNLVEH